MSPVFYNFTRHNLLKLEANRIYLALGLVRICNVRIPYQASVFVQSSVSMTMNRKDISLLQTLSIFRKLRINNVL